MASPQPCTTVTATRSLYQFQTAIVTIVLIVGIIAGIWLLKLHEPYLMIVRGDLDKVTATQALLTFFAFVLTVVLAWVIGDMIDTSQTCTGTVKKPKSGQIAIPIIVAVGLIVVPPVYVYVTQK
jgi:amino acid transporter